MLIATKQPLANQFNGFGCVRIRVFKVAQCANFYFIFYSTECLYMQTM